MTLCSISCMGLFFSQIRFFACFAKVPACLARRMVLYTDLLEGCRSHNISNREFLRKARDEKCV